MYSTFIKIASTGIHQTFGKFSNGLYIHTITPISNRAHQNVFTFVTKTKDNIPVKLDISIPNQDNSDVEYIVRSEVSKMNLKDLCESQDDFRKYIQVQLNDKILEYGVFIESPLISNIKELNTMADIGRSKNNKTLFFD